MNYDKEIIKQIYSVLKYNPNFFLTLGFGASLPSVLIFYTLIDLDVIFEGSASIIDLLWLLYGGAVLWYMALLIVGPISYGVIKYFQGQKSSLQEALSFSLTDKLFAICLLFTVSVILIQYIVGFLLALMGIEESIAKVLLIALSVIIICPLSIAIPSCLFENLSAIDSLKRSLELTKGYWLNIFGLLFLFVIVFSGFLILLPESNFIIFDLIALTILNCILGIMFSILYFDLRARKESTSILNLP